MAQPPSAYDRAIQVLDQLRRPLPQGPLTTQDGLPQGDPVFRGVPNVHGMQQWLDHLGYSQTDIARLNIIHVAGTKGKGSTCAFIEAFLRQHGRRTGFPQKTGLYTSPHLLRIPERIRINSDPLDDESFGKYVLEVFECLSATGARLPGYLQMLALVSFHAFLCEGVDVAVYEAHRGGEYDATNVIANPVITAITTIGIDHIRGLGPTVENIAWHKAGILKPGSLAFSAAQEPSVSRVLSARAASCGLNLEFVDMDSNLLTDLELDVQRINCSLAHKVSEAFLVQLQRPAATFERDGDLLSAEDVTAGIQNFYWPGRFDIVEADGYTCFLDGAHNEISVDKAASWFISQSLIRSHGEEATRVLIFAQNSSQRDGEKVVTCLAKSVTTPFHHVLFTSYPHSIYAQPTAQPGPSVRLKADSYDDRESAVLKTYKRIWDGIHVGGDSSCVRDFEEAVQQAARWGTHPRHVLVTGSLYLVGGVLNLLRSQGWYRQPGNRADA